MMRRLRCRRLGGFDPASVERSRRGWCHDAHDAVGARSRAGGAPESSGGGGNRTRARLPPTVDLETRLSLSRAPRADALIAAPGHETSPLLAGEVAPGHAAGLACP